MNQQLPSGALRKIDAHAFERQAEDWYVEPAWVTDRLLDVERFFGQIWDPCCGIGTIPKVVINRGFTSAASDIVDRGMGNGRLDFLKFRFSAAIGPSGDNVICNPPFNLAPEFAAHALTQVTGKVAIVFPVPRLNAAHKWLSGLPLATIWFLTPRPSMPPGEVILRGEKPGGGKVDFAWLVFDRGHTGPPNARWLHRDGRV